MLMAIHAPSRAHRVEVRSSAEAALPPPEKQQEEIHLVEALKRGDESAFLALIEQHESAMLRVAFGFVGTRARAEDVVQETWLGVIRGLGTFRHESSLKTWIFRILLNRARSTGRREARNVPFCDLHTPDGDATTDPADRLTGEIGEVAAGRRHPAPLQDVLDRELGMRLEAAISALPELQRLVLTMRDVEGFSSEEVCNVLRISDTNQRVLLHRARGRVRRELDSYVTDGTIQDDAQARLC
jgi:RNA polymerase sigma-70 factor (ECF subfamily)